TNRQRETLGDAMNADWLDLYPPGVPATPDLRPWPSLAHMFSDCCDRFAERMAFVSLDSALTYADIEQRSRAFAAWLLQKRGLQPGQRIALMLPNSLQYAITLFGALRAGLVVVNVNPL